MVTVGGDSYHLFGGGEVVTFGFSLLAGYLTAILFALETANFVIDFRKKSKKGEGSF